MGSQRSGRLPAARGRDRRWVRLAPSGLGLVAGAMLIAAGASGTGPALAASLPTPILPTPTLPVPLPLPTPTLLPTPSPPPVVPPAIVSSAVPAPVPAPVPGGGGSSRSGGGASGSGGSSASRQPPAGRGTSSSPAADSNVDNSGQHHDPAHTSEYRDDEVSQRGAAQTQEQEAAILQQLAQLEMEYGALAVAAGGGRGHFAAPELADASHPVPITQVFGCSQLEGEPFSPKCATKHVHTGIDIAGPADTPIFASDSGVATVVHGTTGYGNFIVLEEGNGYATLFGHLDKTLVATGQVVHQGEVIGLEGTSGYSTGDHLHFEIRYKGAFVDPCTELICQAQTLVGGAEAKLLGARPWAPTTAAASPAADPGGFWEIPSPATVRGPE